MTWKEEMNTHRERIKEVRRRLQAHLAAPVMTTKAAAYLAAIYREEEHRIKKRVEALSTDGFGRGASATLLLEDLAITAASCATKYESLAAQDDAAVAAEWKREESVLRTALGVLRAREFVELFANPMGGANLFPMGEKEKE